ncbi:MAG TPA: hypothetical protein VF169_27755 [Albitalea sp.]|uniref:hypothetical protein n=1 Tax=Piscinibacter sp. TaxID=1903157 RepID=UPI002ED4B7F1
MPTLPIDIVVAAHKATRRFMFETLVAIGALDVTDGHDIDRSLNLLERLLEVLGETRDDWRDTIHGLRHGAASQRRGLAARLYRDLAELVSRELARLQRREAQAGAQPAAVALERLDDDELRGALHWMEGALTPQELAGLLDQLHTHANAPRFNLALAVLAERMDNRRWHQLARALDLHRDTAPVALAA